MTIKKRLSYYEFVIRIDTTLETLITSAIIYSWMEKWPCKAWFVSTPSI